MKDGYLEEADLLCPLPVKRRSDDRIVGVMYLPSEDSHCARIQPFQGYVIDDSAYALFKDPKTGRSYKIDLPVEAFQQFYEEHEGKELTLVKASAAQ